jgi:Yip1 domain
MANGAADSITPFFTIWTEPRATIRRIVNSDPTRYVLTLAALAPALSGLAGQWSRALSNNANLSALWPIWVVFVVAIHGALGIFALYFFGALYRWSGSLLGGIATNVEVRAAMAYSHIPAIIAVIVLMLAMVLGVPMPTLHRGEFPHIEPPFYNVILVETVLLIWRFFISMKCLGEVHRFSAWRAFGAVVIPFAILIAAILFVAWMVSGLAGHH